jgi:hypothetical protein
VNRNYPLQQSGTSGCCNLEDDLGQPTWILLSRLLTPPITPHVKTWMVSGRCSNLHSPTFFISDDDWRINHRCYIIRISKVKVSHANRYEAVQCEAMQRAYKARTHEACKRLSVSTTYIWCTTLTSITIHFRGPNLFWYLMKQSYKPTVRLLKDPKLSFAYLWIGIAEVISHRHHLVAEPDVPPLLATKSVHTILSQFHLSPILNMVSHIRATKISQYQLFDFKHSSNA